MKPKDFIDLSIIFLIECFSLFAIKIAATRWYSYFEQIVKGMPDPYVLFSMPLEEVQAILSPDPRLLIISTFILMLLVIILVVSVSRAAIWLFIERNLKPKAFLKMSAILSIWFALTIIPTFALATIMKNGINLIFLAFMSFAIIHFTVMIDMHLRKEQTFRKVLQALKAGVTKLHWMLIIYIPFIMLSFSAWLFIEGIFYIIPQALLLVIARRILTIKFINIKIKI